jgi:hypothetical protein
MKTDRGETVAIFLPGGSLEIIARKSVTSRPEAGA